MVIVRWVKGMDCQGWLSDPPWMSLSELTLIPSGFNTVGIVMCRKWGCHQVEVTSMWAVEKRTPFLFCHILFPLFWWYSASPAWETGLVRSQHGANLGKNFFQLAAVTSKLNPWGHGHGPVTEWGWGIFPSGCWVRSELHRRAVMGTVSCWLGWRAAHQSVSGHRLAQGQL